MVVAAARQLAGDAAIGVSFLSIFAVSWVATLVGWWGGVSFAALATAAFLCGERLDHNGLTGGRLAAATTIHSAVFVAAAAWTTRAVRRQRRAAESLALRDEALRELEPLRQLLTPSPLARIAGLDVADAHVPAETPVAGDFRMAIERTDGAVLFVVGDVVGHGVRAAELATFVRLVLTTLAKTVGDPAELLALANTALLEHRGSRDDFVTVVCVEADPYTRTAAWASAGHPPPYELDTGRPLRADGSASLPLGVAEPWQGSSQQIALGPGGGLLLFTDGLTEARRRPFDPDAPSSPVLGAEAVSEALIELEGHSPSVIVTELKRTACAFADNAVADDLTLVAFRLDNDSVSQSEDVDDRSACPTER
jgi:serine phosphatase RsbU (regulator of sigma subunit)